MIAPDMALIVQLPIMSSITTGASAGTHAKPRRPTAGTKRRATPGHELGREQRKHRGADQREAKPTEFWSKIARAGSKSRLRSTLVRRG
jgi:hypothetical protein